MSIAAAEVHRATVHRRRGQKDVERIRLSLGHRHYSMQMRPLEPPLAFGREFPSLLPGGRINGIQVPVITDDVHHAVSDRGRRRDASARRELPPQVPVAQIDRIELPVRTPDVYGLPLDR